MIPERLIYCWYGKGEMSPTIVKCMRTWKRVYPDWSVVKLDETNSDLDCNAYVRGAAERQKWALVSDYFRVKELWENGGVYLDTDIVCYRPFGALMEREAFFGYMYDGLLSCGVLGFRPHHPLLELMLQIYDRAEWVEGSQRFDVTMPDGRKFNLNSNNTVFTYAVMYLYPDFKLDGQRHEYADFVILPRQEVETGYVLRRGCCVHLAESSWKRISKQQRVMRALKRFGACVPLVHLDALMRNLYSIRHTRKCLFYDRYKRDGGRL